MGLRVFIVNHQAEVTAWCQEFFGIASEKAVLITDSLPGQGNRVNGFAPIQGAEFESVDAARRQIRFSMIVR